MPIPPKQALKSTCKSCGWSVVIKHQSDAIFQPSKCKRCGSEKLLFTQANFIENLLATSITFVKLKNRSKTLPLKCNNIEMLLDFIVKKHPQAKVSHPTAVQTKIDFPDGLVMNIFNTGSVNFQGNSYENHTASDIVNVIDAINRT